MTRAAFAAALASLWLASAADAATSKTAGDLRVVGAGGTVLAEHVQYTGTVAVPTDEKADCFGPGTGGSGNAVKVRGATAVGLLADAVPTHDPLSPLSVTDSFASGLGVCGIGGDVAPAEGLWSLRVNHRAADAGGDGAPIEPGNEVLWHLVEDFSQAAPVELVIKDLLPALSGEKGKIPVRVFEYTEDGKRSPAAGVRIKGDGKAQPTDEAGKTLVRVGDDLGSFRAVRDDAIPSNSLEVCIVLELGCTAGEMLDVSGSVRADRITAGPRLPVHVAAGDGDDFVDLSRLKPDAYAFVECGPGDDQVSMREDTDAVIRRSCETVGVSTP